MSEELAKIEKSFFEYERKSPLGAFDVDFAALGPPPHTELDRVRCDRCLDGLWLLTLTSEEAKLWQAWPMVPEGPLLRSMNEKLDRLIIVMADVLGKPFIDYCFSYQRRMVDWRKECPELYRELGEALAHGAEFERTAPYDGGFVQDDGKWKAVMARLQDPHAYLARERALIEWRLVREMMKSFMAENPHATLDEMWPYIDSKMLADPETFRLFKVWRTSLKDYLIYQEGQDTLGEAIRRRPEGFVNLWGSYRTGREAVSLSNDIRNMGKRLDEGKV